MTTSAPPPLLFWLMLGCLVVTFALYANTFFNEWVYDDVPVIVQNPDIQSLPSFFENNRPGRPLREMSLILDRAIFGMQPAGWHIQHLFWHALNGFLVGFLALRMRIRPITAGLAALIFLVHPLQVEVVANLSHRKDNLALALALLALHLWMSACGADLRRRMWYGMASVALFVLGCLAKESVVVLPIIVCIYEQLFLPRQDRMITRSLRPVTAIVATGLIAGLVWYLFMGGRKWLLTEVGYQLLRYNYVDSVSEWTWLPILLKSWLFMFSRVVWPVNLAVEYAYPLPQGWFDLWVVGALLLMIGWGVAVVCCWRRSPVAAMALLWIGIFWLPVANLWPSTYFAADRYLYAPLVGIALLAGDGVDTFLPSRRELVLSLSALLLLGGALLSWRQSAVWRSNPALWEQACRVSPESVTALNNHGVHLFRQGHSQEGLALIEKAAQNPYYFEANQNAAMIYKRMGMKERAEYYFKRAGDPHAGNKFTRF